MKYNKEIIDVLFPFLDKPLEEEWESIKSRHSKLSRQERDSVTELCSQLEEESNGIKELRKTP